MLRHFLDGAFGNRHLNYLFIHLGLVNFGQILRLQISGVFFLERGFSLAAVCFIMGALIGLRFLLRTPLVLIPHWFGCKPALVIGQFILALGFVCFAVSEQRSSLLWVGLVLMSAGEALYWHAYHTVFATLAEHGKFGRQLSGRTMFMNAGALCAPLATALLHQTGSWNLIYLLSAMALLLSLLPLLFLPEPCPARPLDIRTGLKVDKAGMKLFAGWGASSAVMAVIWPMAIFLQLGTVEKFSWMLAVTIILSTFMTMFVARRIDLGHGLAVVAWGALAYAASVIALAVLGRTPLSIAVITAVMTLCSYSYTHPFIASLYRWAKETQDPLWFHYWSEFGWDLGNLVVLWSASLILYLQSDLSLRWAMLLILPTLLWSYLVYKTDGRLFSRAGKATS